MVDRFIHRWARYDTVVVCFVSFLLLSNITATKIIAIPLGFIDLIFDGGVILFPFTYIIGDVLTEVYGLKRARRAIFLGFFISILASLTLIIVQYAPPAPEYANQEAFAAVLGFVPRIVAASLCAYLIGQLLNAHVLAKMKEATSGRHLWARLIGSTIIGEGADTIIFCLIAFGGVLSSGVMVNYILVGFASKVAIEVVLLPVTYRVIAIFRRTHANRRVSDTSSRGLPLDL
ncbi:MAG: queuosine precursor transporter [Bowdeniella nasicola]|nr:queuosine precursor transporter [Bowdeniella nasicola]